MEGDRTYVFELIDLRHGEQLDSALYRFEGCPRASTGFRLVYLVIHAAAYTRRTPCRAQRASKDESGQ